MNHLFFGSVQQGLGEKSREFIISIENHHRMLSQFIGMLDRSGSCPKRQSD